MPDCLVIALDGRKAGGVMVTWPRDTNKTLYAAVVANIDTALNTGANGIGVASPVIGVPGPVPLCADG